MNRRIVRLCLVYNANSGRLGAWIDSARKIFMVKGCELCTITHGIAGERDEWRSCRAQIGVPIEYFHRDDVPEPVSKVAGELPCIVAEVEDGTFELLVPAQSLNECGGRVSELKGRLFIRAVSKGLLLPDA